MEIKLLNKDIVIINEQRFRISAIKRYYLDRAVLYIDFGDNSFAFSAGTEEHAKELIKELDSIITEICSTKKRIRKNIHSEIL